MKIVIIFLFVYIGYLQANTMEKRGLKVSDKSLACYSYGKEIKQAFTSYIRHKETICRNNRRLSICHPGEQNMKLSIFYANLTYNLVHKYLRKCETQASFRYFQWRKKVLISSGKSSDEENSNLVNEPGY